MEVKRCIENDLLVITGIENNLNKYFEQKEIQDRIFYILQERNVINTTKSIYKSVIKEKGILDFLKENDLYRCYGREENKVVLLYPDIWVMVTMESSSENMAKIMLQAAGEKTSFDFIPVSFKSEEQQKQSIINNKKAREYFGITNRSDLHLHHINPDWKYNDVDRYVKWDYENGDVVVMTASAHIKLHQSLRK